MLVDVAALLLVNLFARLVTHSGAMGPRTAPALLLLPAGLGQRDGTAALVTRAIEHRKAPDLFAMYIEGDGANLELRRRAAARREGSEAVADAEDEGEAGAVMGGGKVSIKASAGGAWGP